MLKYSEGLRNGLMVDGSLLSLIEGSEIRLYSGSVPPSPNDGVGASEVLCVITVDGDGTGIGFDGTASGGVLRKLDSEAWLGEVLISGSATYFRIVQPSDTDGVSFDSYRIQGTVGVGAADMNLDSQALLQGATQTIDTCYLTMPEA